MEYPKRTEDGEPLIYHRLTGLNRGVGASEADRRNVEGAIRAGLVLVPWSERVESDDESEAFGIDPIDVVAGDGDAVFFSVGAPYAAAKAELNRGGGVAFRLSDLLALGACTLRPFDMQRYYLMVQGPLDEAGSLDYIRQYGSFDEHVDVLAPLDDCCALLRRVIEKPCTEALVRALLSGSLPNDPRCTRGAVTDSERRRAAERVREVTEAHLDEEQILIGELEHAVFQALGDAIDEGCTEWTNVSYQRAELLVWAPVPLQLAVLVFDRRGWQWRLPTSGVSGLATQPRPLYSAG